jgi:hypothetical protein
MKGEMKQQGVATTFYFLLKDNCSWSWVQDIAQGTKTYFKDFPQTTGQFSDIPKDLNYNCKAVDSIDQSLFEPPQSINFLEVTTQFLK